MKNKVYLDNDTLESIKEEGIYQAIIELTTEDCPIATTQPDPHTGAKPAA